MVLQSTGTISLSQVQTEFGGTNPIGMDEYYTTAASTHTNGVDGLPPTTSSRMDMSMFYGKAKPDFLLSSPKLSATTVSAAAVIYGLKLYRKAYTGPLINVRNGSTNAVQDFYGSTTGTLVNSAGTLYSTWIGSATGYVTKWYDQSGNGSHISQTTESRQPTLTSNGKLVFNGTFLDKAYSSDVNTPSFSYIIRCKCTNLAGDHQSPLTSRGDTPGTTTGYILYKYPDNLGNGFYHWNGHATGWQDFNCEVTCVQDTLYNIATVYNGSTSTLTTTINNTTVSAIKPLTMNTTAPFRVGAGMTEIPEGGFFWKGEISTVMYFNTAISTTDMDKILSTM